MSKTTAYDYVDEHSKTLYQIVRYYDPKDFRQRRPDGMGGFVWGLGDVRIVPYQLPKVLYAVAKGWTVFNVEGEKDADNLNRAFLYAQYPAVATCNNGGATHWGAEQSRYCTGAKMVILPDDDEKGDLHIISTGRALRAASVTSLKVVKLPASVNDKPIKDISDYLAAGGTLDDLIILVSQADEYYPPVEAPKPAPRIAPVIDYANLQRSRAERWAKVVLDAIADELAAKNDGRHTALNRSAFRIGRLAATGLVSDVECSAALENACYANGSLTKYKLRWFNSEYSSGFKAGKDNPLALPDYLTKLDDSKYKITSNTVSLVRPSEPEIVEPMDSTILASFRFEPRWLFTWGKAFQVATRKVFGTKAKSINRFMEVLVEHPEFGCGTPFTAAQLATAELPLNTIYRAIQWLQKSGSALISVYVYTKDSDQSGNKPASCRASTAYILKPEPELIRDLSNLFRKRSYVDQCEAKQLETIPVYQSMLEGVSGLPTGDELDDLWFDAKDELWIALLPEIAIKQRNVMRKTEQKVRDLRHELKEHGLDAVQGTVREQVQRAITAAMEPATRTSQSGAVNIKAICDETGVSRATVKRIREGMGIAGVPVIKYADAPISSVAEIPAPYAQSRQYRGAFATAQVTRPDGSIVSDVSANNTNLRNYAFGMMADGNQVTLGYRKHDIWKHTTNLTSEDMSMIEKFNRKPQPKEPTIDIETGEPTAPKPKRKRTYREDVPQLVLDMEQARRNAAKLSPRLMELLYPQGMPDDDQ